MAKPPVNDEFFIGWQPKPPRRIGGFVRARTVVIVVAALVLAGLLAALQGTIGTAYWGDVLEFTGILVKDPTAVLVADQPDDESGASVYHLVSPYKFGFDETLADRYHLMHVKLRGRLMYRTDGQALIEAIPESLEAYGEPATHDPLGERVPLGEMTLEGEIVDTKCYLGAMNPGVLKPHRACAILCIKGGIPPMLLVRGPTVDQADYFVLVDESYGAVNDRILDFVGLPVEITGRVERIGNRLILRSDPSSYRLIE